MSATETPAIGRLVSSATVCPPGTVLTGASFTAVMAIVMGSGVWSRFTPPRAVPPVSRTWNRKAAAAAPLTSAAGVNTRCPAAMSAANEIAGGDGVAIVGQRSRRGQRRDPDGVQRIRRAVVGIAKSKVGGGEGGTGILQRCDGRAGAR